MEREHAIKILNARVAGYREVVYVTGRQLSNEAMAQIASKVNINELLGVLPCLVEAAAPQQGSDTPSAESGEHLGEVDGSSNVGSVPVEDVDGLDVLWR